MCTLPCGSRTSQADLNYRLGVLADEMTRAGVNPANLVLQNGSKTYGRAYRLHFRDPVTGGLSDVPALRSSYLGMTKTEADSALRYLIDGLRIARDAAQRPCCAAPRG